MANHLQDQIMAALQQALIDASTNAGANVTIDGVNPTPIGLEDWVEIEAGSEVVESTTIGFPPNQLRAFDVHIKSAVARKTGWRIAAGNLAKQVEQTIAATASSFKAGGLASGGIHLRESVPDKDGTADKVVYAIQQIYTARYRCHANAVDTPL